MIAAVALGLVLLALIDGACAGFRSSVGRSGLIIHRVADRRAARRGATLVAIFLTPTVILTCAVILLRPSRSGLYLRAGQTMLDVYAPYALAVLAALAVYATLGWRKRYLAAVLLGPLTLVRPLVVVLGAALAVGATRDGVVAIAAALAVVGILAVEPAADRLWYAPQLRSQPASLPPKRTEHDRSRAESARKMPYIRFRGLCQAPLSGASRPNRQRERH